MRYPGCYPAAAARSSDDPAATANLPEPAIALQMGHRSMRILRRYIRRGSLFDENAAAALRL